MREVALNHPDWLRMGRLFSNKTLHQATLDVVNIRSAPVSQFHSVGRRL
jgi:hypothetical protein